ncbi:MAG TPA: long-chain-acyl-CoA synthetase [Candidatus Binatia bacterium]|nr:long-chain-acyl-CoA synthetase [Candidatus Binatia bacterium]
MNWRYLYQDLREIPLIVKLATAVREIRRDPTTCGTSIRARAETLPDRPALRFENETLTYAELNGRANRFANLLRNAGVVKGDPVAVMMENSPGLVAAQCAVAKLGAIGALINTQLAADGLRHVLRLSTSRYLLADGACAPSVAALGDLEGMTVWAEGADRLPGGFRSLLDELAGASDAEPDIPKLELGDAFLYIYTSGTTGHPKPALVRHAKFTMGGVTLGKIFGVGADDCIYAPLPLYHGESNFVGFAVALEAGACFASRRKFSAGEFLSDVRRHRATGFVYVGELCRYLLRQPPSADDRKHRLRYAAGAGLRPDIWEEFQRRFAVPRIFEMYGATEGNVSLMNRTGKPGSVGRPYPFQHSQLRLARYDVERGELVRGADGRLVECVPDEPGELLGRTDRGMMHYDGYANDREATEKKLVRGAFEERDAWFRTGDLLRRDRDGYFYFVDRVGDTFRWKGENVATQQVAEVLNGAAQIAESSVYGVELPGHDGRAGMAALVLRNGAAFDPRALYAHVEERLPPYARPLFLRVSPAIEATGTLKQRKSGTQREGFDPARVRDPLYVRDAAAKTYVPLTTDLHEEIVGGRRRI